MHFEKHFENYVDKIDSKVCKQQLDVIYEQKKGIKIRRKCSWYEYCEKSANFFLNLMSLLTKMKLQIRQK